MGKPIGEAKEEMEFAVGKDEFMDLLLKSLQPQTFGSCLVVRDPFGVVAILSPWNFPVDEILLLALPSLASGNTGTSGMRFFVEKHMFSSSVLLVSRWLTKFPSIAYYYSHCQTFRGRPRNGCLVGPHTRIGPAFRRLAIGPRRWRRRQAIGLPSPDSHDCHDG
jgi:hypothetical protein